MLALRGGLGFLKTFLFFFKHCKPSRVGWLINLFNENKWIHKQISIDSRRGAVRGWLLMDVERVPRKQQPKTHFEEAVNKQKHFFFQVRKTSEKLQNRLRHIVKHIAILEVQLISSELHTSPPFPLQRQICQSQIRGRAFFQPSLDFQKPRCGVFTVCLQCVGNVCRTDRAPSIKLTLGPFF